MANILSFESRREREEYVAALLAQRRDYRQEIKDLTKRYRYVVFYGCGVFFHSLLGTWANQVGRRIDFCCDTDSTKWGKHFSGIRCLSPQELEGIKDESVVFVTVGDFKPVLRLLAERGFPAVNVIYKYDLGSTDFLAAGNPPEIATSICNAFDVLSDAKSARVFAAIINRVLDGYDYETMADVYEGAQYFPPDIIRLSKHESFVDCGAFTGDTVREFVSRTNGIFDNIFSFEMDATNFQSLQETVRQIPNSGRIRSYNLGVWDRDEEAAYAIDQLQSSVGSGEGTAHLVPLDNVLKGERVTFIKMDVESAEPRALRGARSIIRVQKPKLAICIYHDFRHLWDIPLYIKQLVPEYKIYLRHHTNLEYETVCYAVL